MALLPPWEKYPNPNTQKWEHPKETPKVTVSLPSLFSDQFFLGFQEQIDRWAPLTKLKPVSFPPYNLIKIDDDNYKVELAIAGYTKEDIAITVEKDVLRVTSNLKEDKSKDEVIHQGIAERNWTQQFILGEFMEVTSADLKDGLLTIKVERKLPEELKPQVISIN